jgi:hypothetical protein
MEKLPYREVSVETPVGVHCKGKAIDVEVRFHTPLFPII